MILLSALAFTVLTFETTKRKPRYFGSYYTLSTSSAIYEGEKRIKLNSSDKGGVHE